VLDAWVAAPGVPTYESGSDGPPAAAQLIARDGARAWRPVATASGRNP
jgi:glucose-6-phosphate 1-dehydrogenase